MKKVLTICLSLAMVLVMVGCGSDEKPAVSENDSSAESSIQAETETNEVETREDVLTVDNCPELKKILSMKSELDPAYAEFAERYEGKTVEFDGCITYVANHGSYKTRYDILMSAGDYINEDTANPGPIFRFEDVNCSDLGISDLSLPGFVSEGTNISIKAEVDSFDSNSGIFELEPIIIEER